MFRPIDSAGRNTSVGRNIAGSIELRVGDRAVLTPDLWDDVVDLWCYVATMIGDFVSGRPVVETYFPDQPIRLELSVVTDRLVAVTVEAGTERRRAVAARWDLLQELCTAGIAFFDRLAEIGASDDYAGARRILEESRSRDFA